MGEPVQLVGGLHDDEGDLKRFQQALQPLDSVRVVDDADRLSDWMEVDVEPFFTDVDSDIHLRCVWFGRDLALHAGLAPHHLFRPSAKDGRIQLTRGSEPRGPRSRPPDRLGVATPRRSSRGLKRFGTNRPCKGFPPSRIFERWRWSVASVWRWQRRRNYQSYQNNQDVRSGASSSRPDRDLKARGAGPFAWRENPCSTRKIPCAFPARDKKIPCVSA